MSIAAKPPISSRKFMPRNYNPVPGDLKIEWNVFSFEGLLLFTQELVTESLETALLAIILEEGIDLQPQFLVVLANSDRPLLLL